MGGLGSELKRQIEGAGDLLMMHATGFFTLFEFQFRKVPYDKIVRQGFVRMVRSSDGASSSWFVSISSGYDDRLGGSQ
jgi:hypothetical protein